MFFPPCGPDIRRERKSGHSRQVSMAQRNSKTLCHSKGHEEVTVSVQPFYDVQWSVRNSHVLFVPFASDCQGHVAHESVLVLSWKILIMWIQWLKILQFDWYHQHSSDVHKNRSKVTRPSFSPHARCERLTYETTWTPDLRLIHPLQSKVLVTVSLFAAFKIIMYSICISPHSLHLQSHGRVNREQTWGGKV